jgi:hypothetical protein
LETALDEFSPSVVVLNPLDYRDDAVNWVVTLTANRPNAVLVFNTTLSPRSARMIVAAGRVTPVEVVLRGAESEPETLKRICLAWESSLSALVLRGLSPRIAALPADSAAILIGLFVAPVPVTVRSLMQQFRSSPDAVRAGLRLVGLRNPHQLRWCALLVVALTTLMESTDETIEGVARRCELGSLKTFRRRCLSVLGLTPHVARDATRADLAKRLVHAATVPSESLSR